MQTFFIVGAQKSGTTWLQRLFHDIPEVACFGESHFVDRLVLPVANTINDYNKMMTLVSNRVYEGEGYYQGVSNSELLAIMQIWLLRIWRRTAKENWDNLLLVGDKTPAHSMHMHTLQAIFPDTKFLHMLRDGRDVVVSAYYHRARILRQIGQINQLKTLSQEAPSLFIKWKHYTQAVLNYEKEGCLVHTIRYEDLRTEPEQELLIALNFLLPSNNWSEHSVRTAIANNDFKKRSGGRDAGQVNEQAFLRKGISGGWQQELSASDFKSWDEQGLSLMEELGYDL